MGNICTKFEAHGTKNLNIGVMQINLSLIGNCTCYATITARIFTNLCFNTHLYTDSHDLFVITDLQVILLI